MRGERQQEVGVEGLQQQRLLEVEGDRQRLVEVEGNRQRLVEEEGDRQRLVKGRTSIAGGRGWLGFGWGTGSFEL